MLEFDPLPFKNLCFVEWMDARGTSPDWRTIDEAKNDGTCICHTIGWVIEETDEFIQIAPHFSDDEEVSGDMTIPKSAIIKSFYNMLLRKK